jgi:hypothetical protein
MATEAFPSVRCVRPVSPPNALALLSGSRKRTKCFDVVLVGIQRAQRSQISEARVPFRNKVCSRAPGKLGLPVFHGNYVRNHACVPAVSVCEWMDFRNKLMMESNQAFVEGECFVIDPILCVAEKLGDTLCDFCGITPDAHFMLAIGARPFPNLVEHFGMQG